MDWERARYLMVEQQIRPWDVLDQTVLRLLLEVKREDFVPEIHRNLALVDVELPLSNGTKTWQPRMEARVAQEVKLTGSERVLLIGVSAGYLAALLGKLSKHVYAVELDSELAEAAAARLTRGGIHNVSVEVGDAVRGWDKHAPYDVIIAASSYPLKPDFLIDQVREGGRVFAVVGEAPAMSATRYTKTAAGVREEKLFETVIAPFASAPQPAHFSF